MKFDKIHWFWITNFATNKVKDISLGIHICWDGRIDLHFWWWMVSLGKVPVYINTVQNYKIAVSNSFHKHKKLPYRAGIP